MGERLNGIQEIVSSISPISTKNRKGLGIVRSKAFFTKVLPTLKTMDTEGRQKNVNPDFKKGA